MRRSLSRFPCLLSLLCIFGGELVGTNLEGHGLNFFCLQREMAVKASGGNGWFACVYSGSWVLQKAQVLNFCASTLHLRCVSPHAGAVCHTVVHKLAVAVSTGKDWSWHPHCPQPEAALQDTPVHQEKLKGRSLRVSKKQIWLFTFFFFFLKCIKIMPCRNLFGNAL